MLVDLAGGYDRYRSLWVDPKWDRSISKFELHEILVIITKWVAISTLIK